jgi:hypothetical protein
MRQIPRKQARVNSNHHNYCHEAIDPDCSQPAAALGHPADISEKKDVQHGREHRILSAAALHTKPAGRSERLLTRLKCSEH